MKRIIACLLSVILALTAGSAIAKAQEIVEIKMVPTDSLVRLLRHSFNIKIFYPAEEGDKTVLTVKAPVENFVQASLDEMKAKGYTISEYDGACYILRGNGIAKNLPIGYFTTTSTTENDLLSFVDDANTIANFQNKIYEIGDKLNKRTGGSAYVKGHVRNVSNGEALIGIAVIDGNSKSYAMTDEYGYYCINLPVGENTVKFSGYSMDEMELKLLVYGDGDLDVMMKETVLSIQSAVVTGERISAHLSPQMGIEKVTASFARTIPAAFGEADVLQTVLALPGVKTVGEASSGFNVRGGSVDQNLILFNEGTIYNPSHMFGIMSAFNNDVVNTAELYKSSIPAEFGGRISSVLDIKSRTGNSKKITGSVGLGLLTSRFELEGPIASENTTFILGARTTYSDWMLSLLPANSGYAGGSAAFSDFNLGISHKINDRNSINVNGYHSRDKFSFSADTTFHYSNTAVSLKWRHSIDEKSSFTLSTGYDRYSNSMLETVDDYASYEFGSVVQQGFLKGSFKSVLNSAHSINYGLDAIYYNLMPGRRVPFGTVSMIEAAQLDTQHGVQPALFASDDWKINDEWNVNLGARMSSFLALGSKTKFYAYPEFRFSGKYSPMSNLSFKAGVNTMTQYIHLISNSSSVSPMDTWQLCTDRIRPQTGWQAAAGSYWTVFNGKLDLSLEGYYKRMYHYLDYKSGATLSMNPNLADELVETIGRSYGAELMAKKSSGKLTGWVSYTYSRSMLREDGDRGLAAINAGKWYNAPHDKPHDLKIVGNYKLTHRYSISTNLDYSTGRPVTIPVGKYFYGGGYRFEYSERNGYRIPDYFRLDLALIIEPSHYLRQLTHMSVTLGCYNVTGRKNAYSVFYTTNGGTSVNGYMISVFASPIPYINFNMKF